MRIIQSKPIRASLSKSSGPSVPASYDYVDLAKNLSLLHLGDICTDDDLVTIIEQGYIRITSASVAIVQFGLDRKRHSVQLNGPNRSALAKVLRGH